MLRGPMDMGLRGKYRYSRQFLLWQALLLAERIVDSCCIRITKCNS